MATKPRGLGRGLESLLDDSSLFAEYPENESGFTLIPIAKIEPRRDQPRVVFDSEPLEELALSIKEHGVLQPLTVRRLDGEIYQIVAGERRWRAARIAGLDEVPVRIVEADDLAATEIALVENLQRENLNPLEEAAGFQRLMTDYDFTQEDVAESVGKSRSAVANILRLLTLSDDIKEELQKGTISTGHARALLSVANEKSRAKLLNEIISTQMSVRDAEIAARKLNSSNAADTPERKPQKERLFLDDIAQRISENTGRKVKISGNGVKGKLSLEYYTQEDFEKLISIFNLEVR